MADDTFAMTNKVFPEEQITENDLYFLCYMIEPIARKLYYKYVVNSIPKDEWLILSTLQPEEDYIDGMIRIYNDEICDTIDDYNSSAYYEPSYVITRAYNNGGF